MLTRQWWKASYPPRFVQNREEAKIYPNRLFAEVVARDLTLPQGVYSLFNVPKYKTVLLSDKTTLDPKFRERKIILSLEDLR